MRKNKFPAPARWHRAKRPQEMHDRSTSRIRRKPRASKPKRLSVLAATEPMLNRQCFSVNRKNIFVPPTDRNAQHEKLREVGIGTRKLERSPRTAPVWAEYFISDG